jgi:hypothetical protein
VIFFFVMNLITVGALVFYFVNQKNMFQQKSETRRDRCTRWSTFAGRFSKFRRIQAG